MIINNRLEQRFGIITTLISLQGDYLDFFANANGIDGWSGIYYELDYSISEQLSYKISLARLYHSFGSLANSLTDWKTEIGFGVAYEF